MKNILLLNAGTRNTLIRYFKQEAQGKLKIIATDSFNLAPSLYDADKYYVTKWIKEEGYWEEIEIICEKENIGLIISLIDPELDMLAIERERFERKGILVNTSSFPVIRNCFDKKNTLQYLKEQGYPYIKTYSSLSSAISAIGIGELSYPLFFKPNCGSGSSGILKIDNEEALINAANGKEDFLIQEYMNCTELGVDVFVDLLSGEVCSIFAKKKIKMRAGETDKSVSYKNEELFVLIEKFAKEFGLRGANDIDVFERDGEYYISEVNPRFGGGYLHAYECGVNFPKMLVNNLKGIKNEKQIGNYEEDIYMMKYFDVIIRKGTELGCLNV